MIAARALGAPVGRLLAFAGIRPHLAHHIGGRHHEFLALGI